jgi:hypothetical protein
MSTEKPTVLQEAELGRAIGRMYIAAQGVSLKASDAACDAMEGASFARRFGFDDVLAKSKFNVRATPEPASQFAS